MDSYPESDNPCLLNALIIKQSATDHLYLRMDLILRLVKRYLDENNQLAATNARYLARIGMELLDRKEHPWLQDARRFQTEKEIEFEKERVRIEDNERAGTYSPEEAALRMKELKAAKKAYRIEQARIYLENEERNNNDTR
ncbi:MAG TPA: hypothetical protein PLB32_00890 [Acidobacteriota bacterium]|nr:hypothetical protein [Acidobacteriota bacterium]